jgi:phenylacetic acid degradation operon negative regulatory protein
VRGRSPRAGSATAAALLAELIATRKPRARSLIVTIFGDTVAAHGGTIWLGSLIVALQPFGVGERLVRTAVLRLAREGWLEARLVGRRSYYRLTPSGRRHTEDAQKRVYAAVPPAWDGRWTLVFFGFPPMKKRRRDALRRALAWEGFGNLAPGLMIHPASDPASLRHALDDEGAIEEVLVLEAGSAARSHRRKLAGLIAGGWNLAALAAEYRDFTARFAPLGDALARATPDPPTSFLARSLAVHEFRRIVLRDPLLPSELLPRDWAGAAAERLLETIYRATTASAEAHIRATFRRTDGNVPPASARYRARFGGI